MAKAKTEHEYTLGDGRTVHVAPGVITFYPLEDGNTSENQDTSPETGEIRDDGVTIFDPEP